MSLQNDFGNYYGASWVRCTVRGKVLPFYVDHVRTGERFREDDYSEEAIQGLRFIGSYLKEDGRTQAATFTLESGNLNLEMEELGYVETDMGLKWLSWRPQRSTKKGLCGRRIQGVNARMGIPMPVVRQIIDSWETTTPLQRQFCSKDGVLFYKGREIGTTTGDKFTVKHQYRYLETFVLKNFPNVAFEVEEQENA